MAIHRVSFWSRRAEPTQIPWSNVPGQEEEEEVEVEEVEVQKDVKKGCLKWVFKRVCGGTFWPVFGRVCLSVASFWIQPDRLIDTPSSIFVDNSLDAGHVMIDCIHH